MALASILGATVAINLVLLLPLALRFGVPIHTLVAMESLLLVGLGALLPRARWSMAVARGATLVIFAALLLALAEVATWRVLARPLNAYLDIHLLPSVLDLMTGSLGVGTTVLILSASLLGLLVAWVALSALAVALPGRARGRSERVLAFALVALGAASVVSQTVISAIPRAETPMVNLLRDQVVWGIRSHEESVRFEARLTDRDPTPVAMPRLQGKDVVIAFIESYGMSAIDDPRYAPVIRPRLGKLEAAVEKAGLSMVSGTLEAPTRGGQSWLAHGSVLSGLWLDSQLRYDIMLGRDVPTLIDDFRHTGQHTVAVMPAITRAWPDGRRFGYDDIHWSGNIDYRGPPLNWVTMPDQFTWHWFEREVRARLDTPVFAELALISSHAPWTPILPVLPEWEAVGDGSVFHGWAEAGPTPSELWRDHDRVREHFAAAVDYALAVATAYVARHVDDDTLLVILGDHQPAPMITGDEVGAAVPVHVISGSPALVRPFVAQGFVPGAFPETGVVNGRMDDFRGWFHGAFGGADDDSMPAAAR